MIRLEMKNFNLILKEEELSSGKIDKNGYLTGEEIQPNDQSRVKERAKFTYFILGKALEKQ